MSRASVYGLVLALTALPFHSTVHSKPARQTVQEQIQAQQASVAKTQELLSDKLATREQQMKQRVRAMYKLSRASFPRLWIEPEQRQAVAKWLGAARRITRRDLAELKLLHEEIRVADRAESRLAVEQEQPVAALPSRHSLRWPVSEHKISAGYGRYRGPSHRVRLRRRGVELTSQVGETVYTPAAGNIRFVGPISGLGMAVIVAHEGYWSILGHLQDVQYKAGDTIGQDASVALAASTAVYLEVRVAVGALGQVVDPTPLLQRRNDR